MNAPTSRAVVAALMMTSSAVAAGAQPARLTVIGPVVGTASAQIRSVNGQATQSTHALPVGAFVRVSGFLNDAGILVGDHVAVLRQATAYAPTAPLDAALSAPNALAVAGATLGVTGTNIEGVTGTNIEGVTGTNIEGVTGTNIEGVTGTNVLGVTGTNIEGVTGTNIEGVTGTNIEGVTGTNIESVTGTNIEGVTGTNIEGVTGTNVLGVTGTNVLGVTGTNFD